MTDSYKLIDSGDGQKLEQFGKYVLIRPCTAAIWKRQDPKKWDLAHASFSRKKPDGWQIHKKLPEKWICHLQDISFEVHLTNFGHLGIFPEHALIWEKMRDLITSQKKKIKVLNLFAYTGGATIAALKAKADVCHLDASHPATEWAKKNVELNGISSKNVRWIVDDVMKFLKREIRRKNYYDAILLDPPTFGRGMKKEVFKIEKDIVSLLEICVSLLSKNPLFLIFSSHTPQFSPNILKNLLSQVMKKGNVLSDEMMISSKTSFSLPCGSFAIWKQSQV